MKATEEVENYFDAIAIEKAAFMQSCLTERADYECVAIWRKGL